LSAMSSVSASLPATHPFPTRRSSDLLAAGGGLHVVQTILVRAAASIQQAATDIVARGAGASGRFVACRAAARASRFATRGPWARSEEHTSELQSRGHLVCGLLLDKYR